MPDTDTRRPETRSAMMSDEHVDPQSSGDAEGEPAGDATGGAVGDAAGYAGPRSQRPCDSTSAAFCPGLSTRAKTDESRRRGDCEVTEATAATVSKVGACHTPGLRMPPTEQRGPGLRAPPIEQRGGGMCSDQPQEGRGADTSSKSKAWRGAEESEGKLSLSTGESKTTGLALIGEATFFGSPFPRSGGVPWHRLCRVGARVSKTGVSSGTGVSSSAYSTSVKTLSANAARCCLILNSEASGTPLPLRPAACEEFPDDPAASGLDASET